MGRLVEACRRGDSAAVYMALREDMAGMLEATESGRDYAAIVKSFVVVQDRIDQLAPAKPKPRANRLAAAQERHLMVVDG